MKVGDLIRIKTGRGCFEDDEDQACIWPEAQGKIGLITAMTQRLFIPAAKVMVLGEIAEFDLDELEIVQ